MDDIPAAILPKAVTKPAPIPIHSGISIPVFASVEGAAVVAVFEAGVGVGVVVEVGGGVGGGVTGATPSNEPAEAGKDLVAPL